MNDGISIDGLAMKRVYDKKTPKISYTSKDYNSIYEDLVNSISDVSEKWTSRDESDPGIVLIKLMSMYGDMLSFNMDKQILECFPNSVTQRKNAAQIFSLVGYKMQWYRSARCDITLVNTYALGATVPRFSKFQTANGEITYTNPFAQFELQPNTSNNGIDYLEELVQGIPVTPSVKSGALVPEPNKPWHDIYSPNVQADEILGNKLYLRDTNIDQDSIILVDNYNEEWILVDNVNLQVETGKFFELRIDEYDRPYLYLVNYWKNMNILNFKLFYVVSAGQNGQIIDNAIKSISSPVYALPDPMETSRVINVARYIKFSNYASTLGYDPETPDEARENASAYINTLDTLVTLDDFTRFGMRQEGVANCLATDLTTDPGYYSEGHLGDINKDGTIDMFDLNLLKNHINDPETFPLTEEQFQLADINGDGELDQNDVDLLQHFIDGEYESAGNCGNETTYYKPLDSLQVKLYIVRDAEHEDQNPDVFKTAIETALEDYKLMPLDVTVDLESIKNYYWTIKGKVYLKKPVGIDVAQDVLVAINNQLRFDFDVDKVPFNTGIRYIDVVHSIEDNVDNTIIDHVDLEPITYTTDEGDEVKINEITGENTYEIPLNPSAETDEGLKYKVTLPMFPIKPNSLALNINDGEYTIKDNGNGKIVNVNGLLQSTGKIDYVTGEIEFAFNAPPNAPIKVKYRQNVITCLRYANLSTQYFEVAEESIKPE